MNCYLLAIKCYLKLNQLDEAMSKCETILECEQNSHALFLKGRILEELKNYSDALNLYRIALKLRPEDESILKRLRRLEDHFC